MYTFVITSYSIHYTKLYDKDLRLTVEYFSKTNTLLESKTYTLYEYYEPNSSKDFQLKVYPPDTMQNYNVTLFDAVPTY